MSIWDDYKTSVRTRINVKQDRPFADRKAVEAQALC